LNALHSLPPETIPLLLLHGILIWWPYNLAQVLPVQDLDLSASLLLCVAFSVWHFSKTQTAGILLAWWATDQCPALHEVKAQKSEGKGVCSMIEALLVNHPSFWRCNKGTSFFSSQWLRFSLDALCDLCPNTM
jgi:hypothetical protein